ncbi:hypothetical protein TWF730_004308 [Orbilia blumenaviensis]|uniref:Uncharacterized protein n=1 Tax=Orbilia blumenaviensis TaxID=1796055 RepID=A0AAV9U0D3_9PEZI
MLQRILLLTAFAISPLLTSAHTPYLDEYNVHNSYGSAFEFSDNIYSRALLTTTRCPPRFYQDNGTYPSYTSGYRKRWSAESWSKVYVHSGESLHFEFGVPHIPALEYPEFRPTVYLVGKCLPSQHAFGYPKPQELEHPSLDLPRSYKFKALRFHLADPIWQPTKFDEKHLDATFLVYLNYTVPVECDGNVYIVVEAYEKRIVEYYVAVGQREGFPYESTDGIASLAATKAWASGDEPGVGRYCKRRGFWERE